MVRDKQQVLFSKLQEVCFQVSELLDGDRSHVDAINCCGPTLSYSCVTA